MLILLAFKIPISESEALVPPAPTYAKEDQRLIYLGNEFVEVQLEKSRGGLHAIINKATGHDYRDNKSATTFPGQLYAVRLVGQQEKVLWQNNIASFSYRLTSNPEESVVELVGMHTEARSGYDATVKVTASVKRNSSLTFWRISIQNRGSQAVDLVIFPIINGLRIGSISDDDYIISPDFFGSKLRDPQKAITSNPNVRCFGVKKYPSIDYRAQLMIIGDKSGGLLLATHDNEGHVKDFGVCRSSQAAGQPLYLAVQHWMPESPSALVSPPYDTVIGVFSGDWYTAADMYREWALKQWWVKEGSLAGRIDLPIWFRRGFSMLTVASYGQFTKFYSFRETVDKVLEYAKEVNSTVLLRWVGWERYGNWMAPDVFPPNEGEEAFRNVIKELHEHGHRVMVPLSAGPLYGNPPYRPGVLSMLDARWLECAKLNRDRSMVVFVAGSARAVHASPACKAFQDWLVQTVTRLAQLGVDAIQLDAMFLYPFDYNTVHANPRGYGSWWAKTTIELLDRVRKAAKAVNPELVLANEGMVEPFISFHELYMADVNNLHTRSENLDYGNNIESVPIFEYLYHEFTLPFSRGYPAGDHRFDAYNNWGIAWGATSGIIPNPGSHDKYTLSKKESAPTASMFAGYARDFTFFGRMLAPPKLDTPINSVAIPIRRSLEEQWQVYNYASQSVLASRWRSPDSRLGFIFINVAESFAKFTTTIDLSNMPDLNGQRAVILRMNREKADVVTLPQERRITLSLTLEPHESVMLQILTREQINSVLLDYNSLKILDQVRSLGGEIERLKTERDSIKVSIASLAARIDAMAKERNDAVGGLEKLKSDYGKLKEDYDSLSSRLQKTEAELTKTESELKATQEGRMSLRNELEQTKSKLSSVRSSLNATKAELDYLQKSFDAAKENQQQESTSARAQLTTWQVLTGVLFVAGMGAMYLIRRQRSR